MMPLETHSGMMFIKHRPTRWNVVSSLLFNSNYGAWYLPVNGFGITTINVHLDVHINVGLHLTNTRDVLHVHLTWYVR
jgi:hypothetical protein